MNDEFFRPRGLYCLVMTWNPDNHEDCKTINLNSTISSALESQKSGVKRTMNKLKTSNANTYGDFEFPETAPLVFPALDDLSSHTGEEEMKKRQKLKKAGGFVSDYMDRRARAAYVSRLYILLLFRYLECLMIFKILGSFRLHRTGTDSTSFTDGKAPR